MHREIHDENYWTTSNYVSGVSATSQTYFLLSATTKRAHLTTQIFSTGGPCSIYLHENPTVTGYGTSVSSFSKNRRGGLSTLKAFKNPSVTVGANVSSFEGVIMGGGRGIGKIGGEFDSRTETITLSAMNYLLEAENNSGNDVDIFFRAEWYEGGV